MKHYWLVGIRSMFKQKLLCILSIIGIMVAVTLVTSMMQLSYLMKTGKINEAKVLYGEQDIRVENITDNQLDLLFNSRYVDEIGVTSQLINVFDSDLNAILVLQETDEIVPHMLRAKLIEGHFPQSAEEIVVDPTIAQHLGLEIGSWTELSIMSQSGNITKQKFKLVGLIEQHASYVANQMGLGFKGLNLSEYEEETLAAAYIKFKDLSNPYGEIENITNSAEILQESVTYNTMLLSARGYNLDSQSDGLVATNSLIVFLSTLIFLSMCVMLYNIFNISTIQRIRHHGILRAIGGTKQQIFISVLMECIILCLISIPLGWLISLATIKFLLFTIHNLFGMDNSMLSMVNSKDGNYYLPYIISGLLSFILCLLSILIPAFRSTKISILSALKGMIEIVLQKNKKDTNLKLPRTMLSLAKHHIYSYGKQGLGIVISLSIGITMFLSFSGLQPLFDPQKLIEREISSDYSLSYEGDFFPYATDEIIPSKIGDELRTFSGVDSIETIQYGTAIDQGNSTATITQVMVMIGYNDMYLEKLLADTQSSFTLSDMKTKNLAILYLPENIESSYHFLPNNGDFVEIQGEEFTVVGNVFKQPALIKGEYASPYYLMSSDIFSKINNNSSFTAMEVFLKQKHTKDEQLQVENYLKSIGKEYSFLKYISLTEALAQLKQTALFAQIIGYSLIALVMFISSVNIINMMYVNILKRKSQLGILRAIGMTKPQLRRTVFFEAALYAAGAMIIGLPLGMLCAWIIANLAEAFSLLLFIRQLIFSFLTLFIICMISAYIPCKHIENQEIIDNIQQFD